MRPRLARAVAIAAGLAILLVGAAHVALNSDAVTGAVRRRVLEKLEPRVGPCTLGKHTRISWTGEVVVGPLEIAGAPGPRPVVSVDSIRVRASLWGLLRGRVEPTRVELVGLSVDCDRHGQRLKALAEALRAPHARTAAEPPSRGSRAFPALEVVGANLWLESDDPGEPAIHSGPYAGSVTFEAPGGPPGAGNVRGNLELPRGGRVDVTAQLPSGPGSTPAAPGVISLAATGVSLSDLAAAWGSPRLEVRSGEASGTLRVELLPDLSQATATIELHLDQLVVSSERLASEPVGPTSLTYTSKVTWNRADATVQLDGSRLQLGKGGFEVPFEAELALSPDIAFDADARLGPIDLQKVISSLPPQLQPGPDAPHLDGPIRAEIHASGPLRRLDDWAVELKLDTSGFKAIAREAPFALREGFSYRPENIDGSQQAVWVGERNPDFVPIAELPPIVAAAVTTSEDASFFTHNGFDLDEIRDSLANAAGGARLRGGSTLTQQLAKNLYLNRERTLARKVREALITLQLEAALPKSRILEIYLNIIEWGPDVHGIGPAARYYFGKDARNLDVTEAVFLASIIPNPVKFGPYFRHRGLTENWQKHLGTEFDRLQERGFLTGEQCQRALREPLAFRESGVPSRGSSRAVARPGR